MKSVVLKGRADATDRLEGLLRSRHHEVNVVDHIEAVSACCHADTPALVFFPEGLPFDQIARLNSLRKQGDWLLIAVTAEPVPSDWCALLNAGAQDCIATAGTDDDLAARLTVLEHRMASCHRSSHTLRGSCPMFDDMPHGMFRSTVEGRFLEVNQALVEMLGYDSGDEVLQLDIARDVYVDTESRQRLLEERTTEIKDRKLRWRRKDGGQITVLLSGRRVASLDGQQPILDYIARDITAHEIMDTELRQRNAELHQSEANLRSLINSLNDLVFVIGVDGTFQRCFDEDHDLFSAAPAQFLGKHFTEVLPPHFAEKIGNAIAKLQATGKPTQLECSVDIRGETHWFDATLSEVAGTNGTSTGYTAVVRNITERKQSARAIQESEARLRSLFENLPDLVLLVDREATIQLVNHGTPDVTPPQLLGLDGFGFIAPTHRPACKEAFRTALNTRTVQRIEALDVFGSHWSCRIVPIDNEPEPIQRALIICTDITEQKTAAEAVEKEQSLLRRLIDLHERDRQLVAYDIHDGFAQQLTGVLFKLQASHEVAAKQPTQAAQLFSEATALLQQSIDEARRLISGLRPPILDEMGIQAAIEYLILEGTESGGPEVEFHHDGQIERLAPPLESTIFRVVQESLNNAYRHSHSDKIRIELRQRKQEVHVAVRDWGVGFDLNTVEEGHFGLQGIRERVRLLGGRVLIDTTPNQGTHIHIQLPLIEPAPSHTTTDNS